MIGRVKQWARRLKRDVHALYLAARDPRTPLAAKIVALLVAGYALSPIDLIPDVIPVLGYLDDLLIVPLGIVLAVRLVPADLMAQFRAEAQEAQTRPVGRVAAAVFVALWIAAGLAALWLIKTRLSP